MSKSLKNDSLLFWALFFKLFLFIYIKDHFYLIFMILSPSFHFKFLSQGSVSPAFWMDIFMLVYVTLWFTDSWLYTEWDLSMGQSFLPCPSFHGKESTVEASALFKEFSLQLRISYFSNMCHKLTNRTRRCVYPSNIFFFSLKFCLYLLLAANTQTPHAM